MLINIFYNSKLTDQPRKVNSVITLLKYSVGVKDDTSKVHDIRDLEKTHRQGSSKLHHTLCGEGNTDK